MEKIIRSICLFTDNPSDKSINKINQIADVLSNNDFIIQTKRLCSPISIKNLNKKINNPEIYLSIGTLKYNKALHQLKDFFDAPNTSFNIDLTKELLNINNIKILFEIIKNKPEKTFNFTYTFNNPPSSPYFPSAQYIRNGFSIGLQPTNLSKGCSSLEEWLNNTKLVWREIYKLFKDDDKFLGIDSSIASLFEKDGSLVKFIKKINKNFSDSTTTDIYLKITDFIKNENPKPVGLCGLMLPCLEDFVLASEYEKGNFSIERDIYLSLHCGLGVDTYPIGVNEKPGRVLEILNLLQKLSNKYNKPLSARFVSDGEVKIGEKTNFKNQYLKDVKIRPL